MTEIEKAIRTEICKALEHLGGPDKLLAAIRDAPKDAMYETAERLGADRYLLGTIASWGDTLDDADVLSMLKECNAGAAAEAATLMGDAGAPATKGSDGKS